MTDKINEIISILFSVPVASVSGTDSPDTIEKWDSLNHINLINALEEEFGIRFSDEEISDMLTVDLVVHITLEKIKIKDGE